MPDREAGAEAGFTQPVVEPRQPLVQHLARGPQRPVGVVVALDRRAEHREQTVAQIGDERAAVIEHRVAHLAEEAVEHLDHPVGRRSTRRMP